MKDLRYYSVKKRKKTFFKNLGTIRTDNKSPKTLELIARKSYDALPSKLKKYIDDPEAMIRYTAQMSKYNMEGFDFYKALSQAAMGNPRYAWLGNRETVWGAFRTQRSDVYSAYLSYMRRRGISGTQYWYDNVEFSKIGGSKVETFLDLDLNTGYDIDKAIVFYGSLIIVYDFSGGYIEEAYLQ